MAKSYLITCMIMKRLRDFQDILCHRKFRTIKEPIRIILSVMSIVKQFGYKWRVFEIKVVEKMLKKFIRREFRKIKEPIRIILSIMSIIKQFEYKWLVLVIRIVKRMILKWNRRKFRTI